MSSAAYVQYNNSHQYHGSGGGVGGYFYNNSDSFNLYQNNSFYQHHQNYGTIPHNEDYYSCNFVNKNANLLSDGSSSDGYLSPESSTSSSSSGNIKEEYSNLHHNYHHPEEFAKIEKDQNNNYERPEIRNCHSPKSLKRRHQFPNVKRNLPRKFPISKNLQNCPAMWPI